MKMSTSSSNSICSDDDEEVREQEERVKQLEEQLSNNLYLYGTHVELVNIYRTMGELSSMREAYARFSKVFPLTSTLWLDWLRAESEVATTKEQKEELLKLFSQAVEDYISVDIWIQYIDIAMTISPSLARTVTEKGLTKVGLHVTQGAVIWEYLRELEAAELATHTPGTDAFNIHLSKLIDVFKRQLSVPLRDMHKTYNEWKELAKNFPADYNIDTKPLEWGYKTALKKLETYEKFETELEKVDGDDVYSVYKKYIGSISDPSTKFCLYERAVEKCCLSPAVWIDYCQFASNIGKEALNVSKRALRNVTWDRDLWIMRLRLLERFEASYADALLCFEEAVVAIPVHENLELWLSFLDYANRTKHIDANQLEKLFTQAIESVEIYDTSYKILRFQAELYSASYGTQEKSQTIWKNILSITENREKAYFWLEYINLEIRRGTLKEARQAFGRAITSCKDNPTCVADAWMMFERTNGTLEEVLVCTEKCKKVYSTLQTTEYFKVPAEVDGSSTKRSRKNDNNTSNKRQKTSHDGIVSLRNKNIPTKEERFRNSDNYNRKRPEISRPPNLDVNKSVFVSNLSSKTDAENLQFMFPNGVATVIYDRNGESRCFGYVEFVSEEEVPTAIARDREPLYGRPVFVSKCKAEGKSSGEDTSTTQFKYSTQAETNKLFIRGLSYSTTEDKLLDVYRPLGANAVRIVTQRSGQSKGLAYVEFSDDTHAKQAMERTDGLEIDGRTVNVSISAPPVRKADNIMGNRIGLSEFKDRKSKSRLQVPFVPRSVVVKTQEGTTRDDGSGDANANVVKKSNADFRQMLLNTKSS